jgi:hypothetical protein
MKLKKNIQLKKNQSQPKLNDQTHKLGQWDWDNSIESG